MVLTNESILERVLKEIPNHPCKSMFIEELPLFEGDWFHVGRTAVEILEESDEIRAFMVSYVDYIQKERDLDERGVAEKNAKDIVGYCTGYVDNVQANRWFDALPDIRHPIMGRERPFLTKEVDAFYIIATNITRKGIEYLNGRLSEISHTGLVSSFDIESADGQNQDGTGYDEDYATFKLTIRKDGLFNDYKSIYLVLNGFIMGVRSKMSEEIGESCKLYIETLDGLQ